MNPLETYVATPDAPPPFEPVPYYIINEDGWMTNMPTLFGVGQTKLQNNPHVPKVPNGFVLNDRKFPAALLQQAHAFFASVYKRRTTESSLFILYNRATDSFRLWAPEQYVSFASVTHRLGDLPSGWTVAGTIHSHCNFSAFHSGTDQHDMAGVPGLHITIGHVNKPNPEYALALSLGQSKFDVDFDDIIDGETSDTPSFPSHWLQFVKSGNAPWSGVTTQYKQHWSHQKQHTPTDFKSKFEPKRGPVSSRQMQDDFSVQPYSYEPYKLWEDEYEEYLTAHDRTQLGGHLPYYGSELSTGEYEHELQDLKYELELIARQCEDLGLTLEYTISYSVTEADYKEIKNDQPAESNNAS